MAQTGMPQEVEQAIRQRVREYHRDLDEICEVALQQGCGVKVLWGEGLSYEMMADSSVPFGHIHEVHPKGSEL